MKKRSFAVMLLVLCMLASLMPATALAANDAGFTDVTKTVYVTAEQLNIRTAPTADDASTIIAAAVKGTALQVVGVNAAGTWYKIRYTVDGVEGFYYVSVKYTSETAPK